MIAGIDPGLKGHAVVVGDGVRLTRVLFVPGKGGRGGSVWADLARTVVQTIPEVTSVVIERPKVYRGGRADPDDILELAGCVGALCGALPPNVRILTPKPSEWKGQIPKEVHHRNLRETLRPEELVLFSGRNTEDKLDAYGLYRYAARLLGT